MKIKKREYIKAWIILGIIILAVTGLLILSFFASKISFHNILLPALLWAISIAGLIFLFVPASNQAIKKDLKLLQENSTENSDRTNRPGLKTEKDSFDINGISRKIIRRFPEETEAAKWSKKILELFVAELEIMSGVVYVKNKDGIFTALATYAFPHSEEAQSFKEGESLGGQASMNRQVLVYRSLPESYKEVFSGLGSARPGYLALIPLIKDGSTFMIIELAGFRWSEEALEQLFQLISRELSNKLDQMGTKEKE